MVVGFLIQAERSASLTNKNTRLRMSCREVESAPGSTPHPKELLESTSRKPEFADCPKRDPEE